MIEMLSSRLKSIKGTHYGLAKRCVKPVFFFGNIYIRFGTKLYRQIVGTPMGPNCAPLVADLSLFCYERDFMMSLSAYKDAVIIEAFNSTSRYLDTTYFDMVNQIYPSELQLDKAVSSDTEENYWSE